jgi:3-isopropylmalate/(R)-2-methylmalate dehydratase large subunit
MTWPPRRRPTERIDVPGSPPRTLVDKVWDAHVVASPLSVRSGDTDVLAVDRILLHEHQVGLIGRAGREGSRVGDPGRIVACSDQQVPTIPSRGEPRPGAQLASAVDRIERASASLGLPMFGPGDHRGGVVNVVAPEQGMILPGHLLVGADAHVATQGALGALAFVISDDEVAEVVASGRVRRMRPGVVRVSVAGSLDTATSAKDVALWLLGRIGPSLAPGQVVELSGAAVRALSLEGRMTLCNLVVETGADSVVIAPDRRTQQYLAGRPFAPRGAAWADEVRRWGTLGSDPGVELDGDVVMWGEAIGPQVTWGTSVWQVAPLDGLVPAPGAQHPDLAHLDREALHEQGLSPGTFLRDVAIDQVFIGSCANARIEDLRAAAEVVRGGRAQVRSWVVPGSWPVKRQAEAEGLHRIFRSAGFEWRDPGCSLCIGANGDAVGPGERLASTANRPVRGRVGPSARVHLMSPASAAAAALAGRLAPPKR